MDKKEVYIKVISNGLLVVAPHSSKVPAIPALPPVWSFAWSPGVSSHLLKTCQWIGHAELFLGVNVCMAQCDEPVSHTVCISVLLYTHSSWDRL